LLRALSLADRFLPRVSHAVTNSARFLPIQGAFDQGRIIVKKSSKVVACFGLFAWASAAFCQISTAPLPSQRVNLAAQASVQVAQDLLTMSLSTTREGTDAQQVQAQLKNALDAALTQAKKEARPGLMAVRTGRFGLSPRYGNNGKITGWQGSTELVLEGQDFARISETAGRLSTLTVAGASFGLTPVQRQTKRLHCFASAPPRLPRPLIFRPIPWARCR